MHHSDQQLIATLKRLYGEAFLRYIFALSGDDDTSLIAGKFPKLAKDLLSLSLVSITSGDSTTDMSHIVASRLAGGDIFVPKQFSNDPIAKYIQEIAVDVWPVLLLRTRAEMMPISMIMRVNHGVEHRYKDYVLKRLIKFEIERLISAGEVDPFRPAHLRVYIDQQHTSTDGYYTLSQSVSEELNHGIYNFDYGVFYDPIFKAPVTVSIKFCDSSHDYLVQASDILANRIFTAYNFNSMELARDIPHHSHISLP